MLTTLKIDAALPRERPYRLNDGQSLFLLVRPSGVKVWEFRFKHDGKVRGIVLGAYGNGRQELGLKAARDRRDDERSLLKNGQDPLAQKWLNKEKERAQLTEAKATKAAARLAKVKENEETARNALTFQTVAEEWIQSTRDTWTAKHAQQTEQSLADHVYPVLGGRPIASIEPKDILDIISGMLADGKVETARRVRQRLDAVFEYAGLRHKLPPNPVVAGKREINKRVKAARRANPIESFPCVPVAEVPQLLRAMRSYVGTATTRSLMWFVALTGCRTGEARHTVWDEFMLDGDDPCWNIPASRMKAGKAHYVPLAPAVVDLLKALPRDRKWVFPHPTKADRPCSENAILFALAAIGFKDRHCGHGFRHLFSTLANASRLHDPDIIEAALAHGDPDKIRERYNKASRMEERRALADLYGDARRKLANWYADELARLEQGNPAKVIDIRQATA